MWETVKKHLSCFIEIFQGFFNNGLFYSRRLSVEIERNRKSKDWLCKFFNSLVSHGRPLEEDF